MRVLLTGGTGQVGISILENLLDAGHEVILLTRSAHVSKSSWGSQAKIHVIDLYDLNKEDLSELPKCDVLVHAAAAILMGCDEKELEALEKVNITASRLLFQWAVANNTNKIVYIGTLNFFPSDTGKTITEKTSIHPENPYAITKRWSELLLGNLPKTVSFYSLRVSSPVPFVFSKLHNNVLKKMLLCALNGKPVKYFGTGCRTQNFVAASDIADAVHLCLESKAESGPYNIAAPDCISMRALAELIAKEFGVDVIQDNRLDSSEHQRWLINIDKAKSQLGFQPKFNCETAILQLINEVKCKSPS